jgi:hypothetical protein
METFEFDIQEMVNILKNEYDENYARCYGVAKTIEREDSEIFNVKEIDSSSDVYDLIDEIAHKAKDLYNNFDFLVFATAGWAAPIDNGNDTPPSQRTDRRRVYLFNVVSKQKEIGSSLVFQDDFENQLIDVGSASGILMDALLEL